MKGPLIFSFSLLAFFFLILPTSLFLSLYPHSSSSHSSHLSFSFIFIHPFAMSARSSIVCYYDVVSPYSYYGVKLLHRYKPQWKDVDVELRPVFLAGVLSVKNKDIGPFIFARKKGSPLFFFLIPHSSPLTANPLSFVATDFESIGVSL